MTLLYVALTLTMLDSTRPGCPACMIHTVVSRGRRHSLRGIVLSGAVYRVGVHALFLAELSWS